MFVGFRVVRQPVSRIVAAIDTGRSDLGTCGESGLDASPVPFRARWHGEGFGVIERGLVANKALCIHISGEFGMVDQHTEGSTLRENTCRDVQPQMQCTELRDIVVRTLISTCGPVDLSSITGFDDGAQSATISAIGAIGCEIVVQLMGHRRMPEERGRCLIEELAKPLAANADHMLPRGQVCKKAAPFRTAVIARKRRESATESRCDRLRVRYLDLEHRPGTHVPCVRSTP